VIERDTSNRYAVFFISPHIYGYEKILEVKWQMDEDEGRGFSQPDISPRFSLFEAEAKMLAQEANYAKLERLLRDFLHNPRTNRELYVQILEWEFLPRHGNQVLKHWQDQELIDVADLHDDRPARKGSFYLNWRSYRQDTPRVKFTLKRS